MKFVVVVVDYFTIWVEAEALTTITTNNIIKFLWNSVVCRYEVPNAIVSDNEKQFDCEHFRDWCSKLHIRNYFSSPGHPQANGQVEATNKTIFRMVKTKRWVRKKVSGRTTYTRYCGPTGLQKRSNRRDSLRIILRSRSNHSCQNWVCQLPGREL